MNRREGGLVTGTGAKIPGRSGGGVYELPPESAELISLSCGTVPIGPSLKTPNSNEGNGGAGLGGIDQIVICTSNLMITSTDLSTSSSISPSASSVVFNGTNATSTTREEGGGRRGSAGSSSQLKEGEGLRGVAPFASLPSSCTEDGGDDGLLRERGPSW